MIAGYAGCGSLWGDLVVWGVDVRSVAEECRYSTRVGSGESRRNCRSGK